MSTLPEAYDQSIVPLKFGLNNTRSICHINSLLQAIVSNSAVVRTTLANRDYLSRTETGKAFHDFIWTAVPGARPQKGKPFAVLRDIESQSAGVLAALVRDLRVRRPKFKYGASQESASEGLVLLLDMIDDPTPRALRDPRTQKPVVLKSGDVAVEENPISRLFFHRYEAVIFCENCKRSVATDLDTSVQFGLFYYSCLKEKPRTPFKFGAMIQSHVSRLEDYTCDKCHKKSEAYRFYRLCMIPEVLVCVFDLYQDRRPRVPHYFPARVPFPGLGGTYLYRQTAQIEQFGGRSGGHYIARARRANEKVYEFNDHHVSESRFGPSPNVYMVMYHFEKLVATDAD